MCHTLDFFSPVFQRATYSVHDSAMASCAMLFATPVVAELRSSRRAAVRTGLHVVPKGGGAEATL